MIESTYQSSTSTVVFRPLSGVQFVVDVADFSLRTDGAISVMEFTCYDEQPCVEIRERGLPTEIRFEIWQDGRLGPSVFVYPKTMTAAFRPGCGFDEVEWQFDIDGSRMVRHGEIVIRPLSELGRPAPSRVRIEIIPAKEPYIIPSGKAWI